MSEIEPFFDRKIFIINKLKLPRIVILTILSLIISGKTLGQVTATISGTTSVCINGFAPLVIFSASGGVTPYIFEYNINGGGTLTVSTTGSNLSATVSASTGTAGIFTYNLVSVTDGTSTTYPASGSAIITVTALPVATFNYPGTPYCSNGIDPLPSYSGGGTAGTFSSTAGLVFVNTATGQVDLSASTPGTYTVTNTIAASGGCGVVTATSSITITKLPVATFSYTLNPYCSNGSDPLPTFSGGGVAGTFSSSAGLVFVNTSTGQVNLASSTAGTYTVTNTIPATGGCGSVSASSSITITKLPVATFSYTLNPYCSNGSNPLPTFSGGGVAGTFTSTTGLVFVNNLTGQVNLASSTPGTYTVTNTVAATGGCSAVSANSSITITSLPTATIFYTGSPWCGNAGVQSVTLVGTAGGTYSAVPSGLSIDASSGAITTSTSTAGTYTVIYTIAASGGCGTATATTTVTISPTPTAPVIGTITQTTCTVATGSVSLNGLPATGTWTLTRNPGCSEHIRIGKQYNSNRSPCRNLYLYRNKFFRMRLSFLRKCCY